MEKMNFYIAVIDYATATAERRSWTTEDLHNDLEVVILSEEDFIDYMNDVFDTDYRKTQEKQFVDFAKTKDMGDGSPNLIYLAKDTFDNFPTFDDTEDYGVGEYDFNQHTVTNHTVLIDFIDYDKYTKDITAEDYAETLTYGAVKLGNYEAIKAYIDSYDAAYEDDFEDDDMYESAQCSTNTITEALRKLSKLK